MKHCTLTIFAASLLLFSCTNDGEKKNAANADSLKLTEQPVAKETTPTPMPDSATMMKNWQMYMTPGEVHKMMATWAGTWNGDISMWMVPGAPEQKTIGTLVNKMIMNGLYLQGTNSGMMMGMPFSGLSTTAYDIHRKEFVNTWIDNMGSGIMVLKGPWDEATKTATMKGKTTDPGTTKDMEVKETFKVIDDNNHQMEMFIIMPDGKEFKTMSIKYTRKK